MSSSALLLSNRPFLIFTRETVPNLGTTISIPPIQKTSRIIVKLRGIQFTNWTPLTEAVVDSNNSNNLSPQSDQTCTVIFNSKIQGKISLYKANTSPTSLTIAFCPKILKNCNLLAFPITREQEHYPRPIINERINSNKVPDKAKEVLIPQSLNKKRITAVMLKLRTTWWLTEQKNNNQNF